MVNQHAPRAYCSLRLLVLYRSVVPSNQAPGARVAIVEVPGDFEPVVQYEWHMSVLSLCLLLFAVCGSLWLLFAGTFTYDKSFLKLHVVIISLGAFQAFCEARVNTRSPLSVTSTAARRLTCLESVSIPRSRILKTSQRVKPIGRFVRGCVSL